MSHAEQQILSLRRLVKSGDLRKHHDIFRFVPSRSSSTEGWTVVVRFGTRGCKKKKHSTREVKVRASGCATRLKRVRRKSLIYCAVKTSWERVPFSSERTLSIVALDVPPRYLFRRNVNFLLSLADTRFLFPNSLQFVPNLRLNASFLDSFHRQCDSYTS